MQGLARKSLTSVLLLLLALLVGVVPAAAQLDLATVSRYMEQAWNGANWPVALALLDQMRQAWPDDQGLIERQARGHLNYGWDLFAAGRCGDAHAQFEHALGLLPGDGEAQRGLALTRERCSQDIPLRAATPVARVTVPSQPSERQESPGAVDRPTRYVVRRGDTLFSLAKRYGVTVADIQRASGLTGDSIRVGMALTIPPPAAPEGFTLHTVRAGETLYSLSQTYGTTVATIQRINGLSGTTITTGQVLFLPEAGAGRVHLVQSGETISGIASRYGVSVDALMRANDLTGTAIGAGQRLVIPESRSDTTPDAADLRHTVRAGETLYSLATRYGTSVAAIQRANGLSGTAIAAGMVLIIPQ